MRARASIRISVVPKRRTRRTYAEPAHPKSVFEAFAGSVMFPRRSYASSLPLLFAAWLVTAGDAPCADVQVLTQHNDLQRTGANLAETSLSPEAVSARGVTKLGSYRVRGKVFTQPLFVTRNGRHTLYVATAANFV